MPRAPSAPSAPQEKATRTAKAAADQGQELGQEVAAQARRVGGHVAGQGKQVTSGAVDQAQELLGSVRAEAARVTDEVSSQVHSLAEETRQQLEVQAEEAAYRLANGFRQLGDEARALAEGRPSEAPNLREYVWQAADRFQSTAEGLSGLASSIEERGVEGLAEDVQSFARRRPAAFLMGAAAAGFLVGRVIRSANSAPPSNRGAPSSPPVSYPSGGARPGTITAAGH